MTPRELRRAMAEQKKALRRKLPLLRKQAREQLDKNPAVRKARNRRRVRRAILIAILIILACLIRCDCGPGTPPPPPEIAKPVPEPVKPKLPVVVPLKKKPLTAKGTPQPRPGYEGTPRAPPKWIDQFQLAVAARSPRLAQCFTGVDRPGALRWTTSVNPESGAVSENELEPVGASSDISTEQRICVIKVLSSPVYKLTVPTSEGLPNRVSLVIEF